MGIYCSLPQGTGKEISQVAGKTMRKQVKAEERAKAILGTGRLKATIQKK